MTTIWARRLSPSLFALALTAASPSSANGGEHLASPSIPGFVVGYSAGNDRQSIREEVPRGENVETWTRMITTQRFNGLVAQASPVVFARTITGSMGQRCPGATASAIRELRIAGHAAARMQVDCPDSGGMPESFVLLAIAGATDMHVKQAAVRGPGAKNKLGWGEHMLDATVLCVDGAPKPACT